MQQQDGLYKTLRIKEVTEEMDGFRTIIFEEGHNIAYKAGQYLTLVKRIAGEEIRRSYSITSSPVLREPLAIGVKRVANGTFSRQLVDTVKPGDELITTGSGGFFVLPDNGVQQLFFFAAGSGITPVYSLIKTALYSFPHTSVILIYSNASPDKTIFLHALQALQAAYPSQLQIEILFSNDANLYRARLHRDLLFSFLQQYKGDGNKHTLFYICGPESYMRLCTYTLQEKGISSDNIRKENFFGSEVSKRDSTPTDKADYNATIRIYGKEYKLTVSYPDSILRAAKKKGLQLPYSCEAGRCGNCVATCLHGQVWHSYNEVLTDKELAQGLVLTCVGHPVGGHVVLEI